LQEERLYETKDEKELRKKLERFKKNPSISCFNHLKYIIENCKNTSLLRYLATEIAQNGSLDSLEPLIADNIYTPPHILAKLALSKNPISRAYVALNLETPLSSIELLKKDENEFIRIIAIKNPKLPKKGFFAKIFEKLSSFINSLKCLLGF